jgi:hypothetical protein
LNIEICGSWIWVSGNTYTYKEQLKESGYHYSRSKKMWYFASEPIDEKRKYRHSQSQDKIRFKYGSEKVETRSAAYIG